MPQQYHEVSKAVIADQWHGHGDLIGGKPLVQVWPREVPFAACRCGGTAAVHGWIPSNAPAAVVVAEGVDPFPEYPQSFVKPGIDGPFSNIQRVVSNDVDRDLAIAEGFEQLEIAAPVAIEQPGLKVCPKDFIVVRPDGTAEAHHPGVFRSLFEKRI